MSVKREVILETSDRRLLLTLGSSLAEAKPVTP